MKGMQMDSPLGKFSYRALDHQSTMGAYVGRLALKDGKGMMVDWNLPMAPISFRVDAEVKAMRPAE